MKKILLFLILVPSFLIQCQRLSEFTQFEMDYDETVVIPSTIGIQLPLNIFTPPIKTENESVFEVNDTRKDLIEEIVLTTLELSLNSPENSDFGFLRSIGIYLTADGLDEVLIAWKEEIPSDIGKLLELETTDIDLQEYIKKDAINLKVQTVTDKILGSDHEIGIHAVFFVDARILGL